MKKLLLFLLLASIIPLSACAEEPAFTIPEIPEGTLPSFPQSKTPLEILTDAADKTKNADFDIIYGRIVDGQDERLESCEDFITNENFLEDFCALSMIASPSNTGIIRYAVTGLTRDQLYALLYGENSGEDSSLYEVFTKAECAIAMEIDADGYLTRIEYTVALYRANTPVSTETTYVQLSPAATTP